MYRQNTVLNDFVNFLKARGRFREIEFIDNSVHATPRIPDFPSLIFYIEEAHSEQQYTLEIHGSESTVMNREIQEFFQLNRLGLKKIRIKDYLETGKGELLTIEIEGIGSSFEILEDQITNLVELGQYSITATQKTLVFSHDTNDTTQKRTRPSQLATKPQPQIEPISKGTIPKVQKSISTPNENVFSLQDIQFRNEYKTTSATKPVSHIKESVSDRPSNSSSLDRLRKISTSPSVTTEKKLIEPIEQPHTPLEEEKPSLKENFEYALATDSEDTLVDEESIPEDLEKDLFHPKPPQKSYSDNITPYLKQTTSLFRRDNWEEDLPTEFEMEILERTYLRIKHRTKPEILAKDMEIPIDEAEFHLRSLISKGLLRTQVGWYIIKKSHLPFFKKTFTDIDKKKKKKKSPRISRVGEGLTQEEISTIKAIKARPNLKAQSNLLTRPTGLKQSVLKEVLRNLVDKGILRVSYGWYILKDKNILEQ
ncbi:MAG: hypothetical protein ACFE95_21250, partial [Candidatus Hodarchaeota archaeon]